MEDGRQTIEQLCEQFPDAVIGVGSYNRQHWVELNLDHLLEVCVWLREEAGYDYLVDVTAVHWPDEPQPMEMVYHLYSTDKNDRVRLKSRTADTGPVPSLAGVWEAADWNERETYDMFGIEFSGHPDPRRILMPDDYTDFPLRKEFPLYRG